MMVLDVLYAALEKIAGEAPRKEPRSYSTVGAPRNWDEETREAADRIAEEAFDQGYARALWEMGQIADAALKATGEA